MRYPLAILTSLLSILVAAAICPRSAPAANDLVAFPENSGMCSVLLDGRLVCSCLVLGVEAQDAEVSTIEGIATDEGLHPIQRQFLEHAALQCGICTPGYIIATKALLEKNPNPDEKTIRYWLAGNLCRCTGYDKIIRAVQDVAAELAHEA